MLRALGYVLWVTGCGRFGFAPDSSATIDASATLDSSDALTAFSTCDATRPDLVACWDFELDFADGTGNGNDGQLTGLAGFAPGIAGNALDIDSRGTIAASPSPEMALTALTAEGWIRPLALPVASRSVIIDHDQHFALWLEPAGNVHCSTTGQVVASATAVVVGAWTHVACTGDGATLSLYLDGALSSSASMPPLSPNLSMIGIAGGWPPGEPFTGLLDLLHVWNRALDAAEVCRQAGTC